MFPPFCVNHSNHFLLLEGAIMMYEYQMKILNTKRVTPTHTHRHIGIKKNRTMFNSI